MTNLYKKTPSNEDDPASGTDDLNTSFEIDEPEDEEIIDDVLIVGRRISAPGVVAATTPRSVSAGTIVNPYAKMHDPTLAASAHVVAPPTHRKASADSSRVMHAVPLVAIRPDDAGELSDSSLESHTASSTPTTADVADITAVAVVSSYTHKVKHLSPLQQAKLGTSTPQSVQLSIGGNSNSMAEDTLSASIATTTTEIDLDGMTPIHAHTRKGSDAHIAQLMNNTAEHADSNHRRTLSNSSHISQHPSQSLPTVQSLQPRSGIWHWLRQMSALFKSSGIGEPSVYHAVIVIFLEFFAWGLLAMPVISVLNQTFPDHTFLMNGLVMGIKGILSFLSAPLVGALSDIWGRKFFLLITVFFTCAPIPLMTINSWWFFAMISISGIFAVTFSVVFAYVADVTTVEERSRAYGLVSATFAASLVISPALGALLREMYSDTLVVALATAIAVLDVFFILVAVPESLPEKVRPLSWGAPISWEQADPFAALRKVGTDHTILMQCVTVLLSYLPEAGQYSCIFVYLKLKMGFNSMEVAIFIAVVGILSISVQVTLGYLMRVLGGKRTIIFGLILEMIQLLWYGFGSQAWMMWAAGILAAIASITYPAISAFVSLHSTADSQGVVQGMVTGMRGLCNGLGPAMFGVIFYFFNVDLNDEQAAIVGETDGSGVQVTTPAVKHSSALPGPPFAIGALLVVLAILVALFIPDSHGEAPLSRAPSEKKRPSKDVQYTLAQL